MNISIKNLKELKMWRKYAAFAMGGTDLAEENAHLRKQVKTLEEERFSIDVHVKNYDEGWAAFSCDPENVSDRIITLNLGSMMLAVHKKDVEPGDLPYMIAEALFHEVIHALELWSGVEFSEEAVVKTIVDLQKTRCEEVVLIKAKKREGDFNG